MLEPAIQSKIDSWLNGPYDDETKAEIKRLSDSGENEALNDA